MNSSNQSSAPPKKNKGRQKITMVKMENQSNLQVTFSKRRAGLFKKASELCTLCAAEAAILVFSPAQKPYCFGHPNVKAVIEKFDAGAPPTPANPRTQLILEAHRNSTIRELNIELTRVESVLKEEKKRSQEIEAVRKAGQMQQWFPYSLDGFSYEELGDLKECIMGFEKNLDLKVQSDMAKLANDINPLPNFHQQITSAENPNAFSLGTVPTFGDDAQKLPLGTSDFNLYSNGGLGFNNPGVFAPNTSLGVANNFSDGSDDQFNLLASMFFGGGTNNSSSSGNPTSSNAVENGGFGFNLGHDPRFY